MNEQLLKSIYAGAVEFEQSSEADKAVIVEDVRNRNEFNRAKRTKHEAQLEGWGQELAHSSIARIIGSLNGLIGLNPEVGGGQKPDHFRAVQEGNTLTLKYVNPAATSWVGDLIKVDLTSSDAGRKAWGVTVLGELSEPRDHYKNGMKHFGRVGEFETSTHQLEQGAYDFIENYVQTHPEAQTLRGAIEKYFADQKAEALDRERMQARKLEA